MVYNFGPVCLSVRIRIKLVYEGHQVKVKVTGAKNVINSNSLSVNFNRQ